MYFVHIFNHWEMRGNVDFWPWPVTLVTLGVNPSHEYLGQFPVPGIIINSMVPQPETLVAIFAIFFLSKIGGCPKVIEQNRKSAGICFISVDLSFWWSKWTVCPKKPGSNAFIFLPIYRRTSYHVEAYQTRQTLLLPALQRK